MWGGVIRKKYAWVFYKVFVGTFIKDPKHLESSLLSGEFIIDMEKCVNTDMGFSVDKALRIVT